MKDIKVDPKITIREAMEILDRTAKKILLVVDDDTKLIGTLTDGDIRRHILEHHDLTGSIENAFNTNPYFVFHETFDLKKIKNIFTEHDINLIPIVNKNRILVDYITPEKAFGENKKIQKQKID